MPDSRVDDAAILEAVADQAGTARDITRFVHAHPELGHEEHACAERLAAALAAGGYELRRRVGGMETAFSATLAGARPGRSVGIAVLYDAVPAVRADGTIEPLHSCGHGPMSGGVVAAALALAALRDELAGSVTVLGCPADEIHAPETVRRGGGKALSAAAGLWDGFDAALYAHPEFIDTVSLRSLWMRRDRAIVPGSRTLRRDVRSAPIEALRALAGALDGLAPDRVIVETVSLDGDVEEGSGLALRASFLLFGDDEAELAVRARPLRESLPDARWDEGPVVSGARPDAAVTEAVADAFAAAGREFVADPPPLPFATDFGDISRRVPAALIGVGRRDGWAFHTDEGAAQFAGPAGDEIALAIARVLALATARLGEPR